MTRLEAAEPTRATNAPPDLTELTSLRFIAALAVLVLHYRDFLGPLPGWVLRGIVGGQYGVTFFFILSGFILTYRYHGWFATGVGDVAFWRFQRLRVARLYPVYLFGLLLDTPWHLIERAQVSQLAAVGTTYWASWLLNAVGLQAWVPAVPFAMFWNTPAWSVSAEFFFYASFPFLVHWLSRRLRSTACLALAFVLAVCGGIALYGAVIYTMNYVVAVGAEAQYIVLVYNPVLRFSEFVAGSLAGWYFVRMQHQPDGLRHRGASLGSARNVVVMVALAAIAARVWMPDYTGPDRWVWLLDVSVKYGSFVLPFTALILAVASGHTVLSGLLLRPWMVALGEASYALYIIHWSGVTILKMGYFGGKPSWTVVAVFLFGTVGASVLCHRWIEAPWRAKLRGPSVF